MPAMTVAFQHHGQSTEAYHSIVHSTTEPNVTTARFHQQDLSHRTSGYQSTSHHVFPQQQPSVMEQQQHAQHDSPALSQSSAAAQQAGSVAPSGDFDMLPPVPSIHASWQALHDYAQLHAAEHGYALSINTTAKNRSRIKLACVCYGQPKNTHKLTPETKIRKNRVSSKTGCKMWVDGKKQDNGTWVLRVGEAHHNHCGRASEDWAIQRKRTWAVAGGRVGIGGVTAQEEANQHGAVPNKTSDIVEQGSEEAELRPMAIHNLERGGIIRKIVEQEMLRTSEPSQGRDRGVGRTVQVLQGRLPGIRILKRDVYNIRAQIRKARKAAGQQVGEGLDDEEADDGDEEQIAEKTSFYESIRQLATTSPASYHNDRHAIHASPRASLLAENIDPSLPSPHGNDRPDYEPPPASATARCEEDEVEQLRQENAELRRLLSEKTDEAKRKSIEIASLRSQTDYMTMISMADDRAR